MAPILFIVCRVCHYLSTTNEPTLVLSPKVARASKLPKPPKVQAVSVAMWPDRGPSQRVAVRPLPRGFQRLLN